MQYSFSLKELLERVKLFIIKKEGCIRVYNSNTAFLYLSSIPLLGSKLYYTKTLPPLQSSRNQQIQPLKNINTLKIPKVVIIIKPHFITNYLTSICTTLKVPDMNIHIREVSHINLFQMINKPRIFRSVLLS